MCLTGKMWSLPVESHMEPFLLGSVMKNMDGQSVCSPGEDAVRVLLVEHVLQVSVISAPCAPTGKSSRS